MTQNQILDDNTNQIRRFNCNKCQHPNYVLKKMADQQHHGFACDKCWATVEKRSRYSGCQIG